MAKRKTAPDAIRYAGTWPDGTLKFARPDGTILPHGTTLRVAGNKAYYTGPDGTPIQVQTNKGGAWSQTGAPVQSITDLPAGSYDPALIYQAGAANRGLGYQNQDYLRDWNGFQIGADGQVVRPTGDVNATEPLRDKAGNPVLDDNGQQIMVPKYGRGVRDYFTNQDRINQQYDWQRDDTARGYRDLGNNQLQGINQRGLLGGGALAQALAKRTTNEARDQERISTGRSQSLADLLGQAQRGSTDAYTGYQRAVGENAPYQATLLTQATQQAAPALADDPNYEVHNGVLYQRGPNGQLVTKKKRKTPKPPKSFGGNKYPDYSGTRPPTRGSGNPYADYPNI